MTSLQTYINSIKSFGRITKEEEKKLSRIIFYSRNLNNVKLAKEKMISCNLLLVINRAFRFSRVYCLKESDLMDLISEGNIGLMRAVDLYRGNHKSGAGFATFAVYHIDQKINRYIKTNRFLKVPEYYLSLRKKMDELEFQYKGKLSNKIIMGKLNISQEILDLLKDKRNRPVLFLEDMFNEEDGKNWEETLIDNSAISPYQENCVKSLRDFLDRYMNLLNDRERKIIRCVNYSEKKMSLKDISKIVHVSRERVRQIYMASLRKLRNYIITGKEKRGGKGGIWRTDVEKEECANKIVKELSIL